MYYPNEEISMYLRKNNPELLKHWDFLSGRLFSLQKNSEIQTLFTTDPIADKLIQAILIKSEFNPRIEINLHTPKYIKISSNGHKILVNTPEQEISQCLLENQDAHLVLHPRSEFAAVIVEKDTVHIWKL